MKPTFKTLDLVMLLLTCIPLIYLWYVYPQLGNSVPLHFGFDGKPDSFGTRTDLLTAVILITVISIGVYLLVKFIPSIDPKKKALASSSVFQKIAIAVNVLMILIGCFIIYSASSGKFDLGNWLFAGMGLLFAIIGNFMYSIKPNYFAGIRTPWTLENEDTWRKTHQLGSRIWVAGGALIVILSLIIPSAQMGFVMTACIIVMVLIPVVYSYICYKQITKKTTSN